MASSRKKKSGTISDASALTGAQKAAIVVITIGKKASGRMLQLLKAKEVEDITLEIANMQNIEPEVVDSVMNEFYLLMEGKRYMMEGGYDYADELLSELGDDENSERVRKMLKAQSGTTAFDEFQESKMTQITNFIQNEHPQVAALIFSQLDESKTAEILSYLDEDLQGEIIYRLSSMEKISSEVIGEIEEVIKEQMGGMYTIGDRLKSGTATVAQILNEAEIQVERHVLEDIKKRDPQMADDIKQQMFLFEDIVHFDDRTVQVIINEMEKSDLVMGLKGVDEEVSQKFLDNMSDRAAGMLMEDMDALGPVPLKDVKEAQQRMIRKIKQLEEEGQITTRKMSEEEIVE
ncbi:flagellar motor switch protein FliG [Aliifodinibius sp. S!AR15-10]|uniref:flagellar motor switch protein FliG n=1 Tax=Aliifodinibius sp. S!AR15-10 TaxID=2950437 RepID=UPI002861F8A9|nr:flagellar motor switch protein FliG [Aliifodinibius sp. S!AR15-10]MDR8394256.1 flagellar motor switch protein FliG [Aliifodinibius sp. S!AR15-10]